MKNLLIVIILLLVVVNSLSQTCFDSANVYSFEYNGVKYDIVKENKKWVEAAYCADLMGGILAEVNSQEEQDTIFHHLNNAEIDPNDNIAPDGGDASYIWIGGNDIAEEGKWIWDGSNDGIGEQFWQGTKTGNAVGGLFNNWGNEPDNFGGQDALGIAITDWPFGKAGKWNDISTDNSLFFVIEYDNSTIPLKKAMYSYDRESIIATSNLSFDYDSLQIVVNDELCTTLFNIAKEDSTFECPYNFSETSTISVRLFAFKNDVSSESKALNIELFKIVNPVNTYATEFEDTPATDFLGEGFEIKREFGFSTKAIHSIHDYEIRKDYTYTLLKPIIISDLSTSLTYSDVAIVEPGTEGSVFGTTEFNDYVVVEGSKNLEQWLPISNGYDASLYPDWTDAWHSGAQYKKLYRKHSFDLSATFQAGDTILVRFRLHSNDKVTGWGWTIDSLSIQPIGSSIEESYNQPGSFELMQNYPNPFNPSTSINFNIPSVESQHAVTLRVYDILGRLVATLINKPLPTGKHKVVFDASNANQRMSSGVYIYKLSLNNIHITKKMLLMK